MVIDRRPQVLKLATRSGICRSLGSIAAALITVHLGKRHWSEKRKQRPRPLSGFLRPGSSWRYVSQVTADYICDGDLSGITGAARRRPKPLLGDVFGEDLLSPFTIVSAASSALAVSAIVLDDPDGRVSDCSRGIAPGSPEMQARSLGGLRHSSLMRSIAASVV
jgi:hypothetical protein